MLFVIFGALVGIGIYLYIEKDNIDVDRVSVDSACLLSVLGKPAFCELRYRPLLR